jgi:hypothetical protein
MHFDDIMNLVLEWFPNAELAEDNDGQLIIYTGLESNGNDLWITMKEHSERNNIEGKE